VIQIACGPDTGQILRARGGSGSGGCPIQENFDKREKKATDNLPAQTNFPAKGCQIAWEKSSKIAWKIVPLRQFFPLKVVPLIEVLLYAECQL
jgi:hypothetical protein